MQETAASPLAAWESFYVIVGSSAAVLTGLMFVVVTLISDVRARVASQEAEAAIKAFATPTVVQFCAVLFVCAVLSAPWHGLWIVGAILGLAGLAGLVYGAITALRMRRQPSYRSDLEDWLWYAALPIAAYAALAVAAVLLPRSPEPALYGIGTVVLLLLFLGLRNAWDGLTYVAVLRRDASDGSEQ
jgi:hypothetical protein